MNDKQMPRQWHTIKSVLLAEMRYADTFHHISMCADALFHARLVGESVAKDVRRLSDENRALYEAPDKPQEGGE